MAKANSSLAGFALDVNVNIQVLDSRNKVKQEVTKHNKATKQMLTGMLNFLRGDYNCTNRRDDINAIRNIYDAKDYIPCYLGVGTYGIKTGTDGLPAYLPGDERRIPPLIDGYDDYTPENPAWSHFTDTNLQKEVSGTARYEIGVIDEAVLNQNSYTYDSVQFVLGADIAPNYFTSVAYGITTDIFITELGLFSTPVPNDGNLLARVTLHNNVNTGINEILYVRPQDTIILRWTICLISLSDLSQTSDIPDVTQNTDMSIGGIVVSDETNINNVEEEQNNG